MRELDYKTMEFDVFHMFDKQWALATAGTPEDYNMLTLAWGSFGTIWGGRSICTIYVSPARYTFNYLESSDTFTVCFFPEEYRKDLAYMGSHSGRDEDKVAHTNLTPVFLPEGITYKEASLTFVCKKIYSDPFELTRTPEDMQKGLYTKVPAHHFYIGEILRVLAPDEE